MINPDHQIATALEHFHSGRIDLAQDLCEKVLASASDNPKALHLQGQLLRLQGMHHEAIRVFERILEQLPGALETLFELALAHLATKQFEKAIETSNRILGLDASLARGHLYLGCAQHSLSKLDDSVRSFENALQLEPDYFEALVNLGNGYHALSRFSDALECYRRAIELRPDQATTYFNLAGTLRQVKRLDEAKASIERSLQLNRNYSRAYQRLGEILADQGKFDEAISAYQTAIELNPRDSQSHIAYGILLRQRGRLEDTVSIYKAALAIEPNSAEVLTNLGNAYSDQGNLVDAVECHRRSLAIKPNSAIAWSNLGQVLQQNGELDESLECYRKAIAVDSNCSKARFNRSLVLLLKGDLERGFEEFEWRWKDSCPAREFSCPLWDGSPLEGKAILLHAEQGLGDTIQFIRYARRIQQMGPRRVIVECQPALVPLLKSCKGIDMLIPRGEVLPRFDTHAPLMSLPRILKTSLQDIPAETPYLKAKPELVVHWKQVLAAIRDVRVGIVWQGGTGYPKDKIRSIPLKQFEGLSQLPGVQLISLQKGFGIEQLAEVEFSPMDFSDKLDETTGPLMDTAALLENVDLLIACDTAIAHLAGALGVPTWIVLNTQPDWRWMIDREDSPWYSSVRLFRQSKANDWAEVFSRIQQSLKREVEKRRTVMLGC